MRIVYKLYEKRIEKGLNLRELEERSGVSRATINRIENQEYNPTILTLCMIAEALNVSPEELYFIEK